MGPVSGRTIFVQNRLWTTRELPVRGPGVRCDWGIRYSCTCGNDALKLGTVLTEWEKRGPNTKRSQTFIVRWCLRHFPSSTTGLGIMLSLFKQYSNWPSLSGHRCLCYVNPCEKVIGMFSQNQIWPRLLDINRLCLVCMKRSSEKVKNCQLSKHGYHQGPSDETLKIARCQFCDIKFGRRIMEAGGFFNYKMHSFTQITFNFTNRRSQGVVWWFSDIILHKWYFHKSWTIK